MLDSEKLHKQIIERYQLESSESCSLSCGSTIDELDVRRGEDILDLGCGRGEDTVAAARLAGPEGTATGLDLTEAMIQRANQHAKEEKVINASFVQGDIEKLPFTEESFDGVMSNCVINHASNKTAVYREIYRVLKPEGRMIVADAVTKMPLPLEVKSDPEAWAQCYGGAITEEEYMDSIFAAGFRNIEVLRRREYLKNDYDFISLTLKAVK